MRFSRLLFVLVIALVVRGAEAHFLWVQADPASSENGQVHLWFSEAAEPGEAHLIGKVAHTKVSLRKLGGQPQSLTLAESKTGATGELATKLPQAGPFSLEAVCDYGVVAKGEKPFLLQYYARHLRTDSVAQLESLGRAESLPLDIAVRPNGQTLELQVLWQGKPAADAEIVVADPAGEIDTLTTDSEGRLKVTSAKPGEYAVRSKFVEADRSGTRDDKSYEQVRHYSTLTFTLAGEQSAKADSDIPATQVLANARAARAIWNDFPGMSADVVITVDGKEQRAKLTLSPVGEVFLKGASGPEVTWADREIWDLARHRLPGDIGDKGAEYADTDTAHPLGRSIRLEGDGMGSIYRIKDDVVTEVNRKTGRGRFTISVLEVHRNAENKYLPRAFTVTFWDENGQIASSDSSTGSWKRVGAYDLPERVLEVHTTPSGREVRELRFSNHKLLEGTGE